MGKKEKEEEAREDTAAIKASFPITVIKSRAAFSSRLASGSSKYVERLGNHLSCSGRLGAPTLSAKKKKNKEAAGKRHLETDPRTPITAPAAFDLTPLDQNPA